MFYLQTLKCGGNRSTFTQHEYYDPGSKHVMRTMYVFYSNSIKTKITLIAALIGQGLGCLFWHFLFSHSSRGQISVKWTFLKLASHLQNPNLLNMQTLRILFSFLAPTGALAQQNTTFDLQVTAPFQPYKPILHAGKIIKYKINLFFSPPTQHWKLLLIGFSWIQWMQCH